MTGLHTDSLAALKEISTKFPDTERLAFVSGNFNIVHPGHLRLLRYAAACADRLVVGVHADNHSGVIIGEELRLEGVRSNTCVDYAFILRDPVQDFIATLKPDVVVKGHEHEDRDNAEASVVRAYGGKLLFSSGEIQFSSVDLLHNEFRALAPRTIISDPGFVRRHEITRNVLEETLERIARLRVIVVGDLIVDEYVSCDALGMSQEDPTIVVTPIMEDRFVGAAGIVAGHVRGLGASVNYFTVSGDDEVATYAAGQLADTGVKAELFRDNSRPTTVKRRYRAGDKTLLRVNRLSQTPVSHEFQDAMFDRIRPHLEQADLLIFADFNYGCLPQSLVDRLIAECSRNEVMMAADCQSSSQVGDVSRYTGMKLMTPTEREARLALQNFTDGLVVIGEKLRRKARAENIFMTLGSEGVLIHASTGSGPDHYLTDRLPALNTLPRDVSGAGDSLLATSALALASGTDIWTSAYLGAIAAACQISRVGNIPLGAADLRAFTDV